MMLHPRKSNAFLLNPACSFSKVCGFSSIFHFPAFAEAASLHPSQGFHQVRTSTPSSWRWKWQPPLVFLPGESPWMEEPGRLQSMGSLRVGHDQRTSLSLFTFMHWRRKWQSTPVFLPRESQGRGILLGCRLWGRTESDMTEVT